MLKSIDKVARDKKLNDLATGFSKLAVSAAIDLNAEIDPDDEEHFDYKNLLKSQKWCKHMSARLVAQHKKDVRRSKADSVEKIFGELLT